MNIKEWEKELIIKQNEVSTISVKISELKKQLSNLETEKNNIDSEVYKINTALEYLRGLNV